MAAGRSTLSPVLDTILKVVLLLPRSNVRLVLTFTCAPSSTFNIPLTWSAVNTSGPPESSVTLPIIRLVDMFSILLNGIPDGISFMDKP